MTAIVRALLEGRAGSVLVTWADTATRTAVRAAEADAHEDERARCVWVARSLPEARGRVAMVSAGTSDGGVLHEARIRAELLGTSVTVQEDIGVAACTGWRRLSPSWPPQTASLLCTIV